MSLLLHTSIHFFGRRALFLLPHFLRRLRLLDNDVVLLVLLHRVACCVGSRCCGCCERRHLSLSSLRHVDVVSTRRRVLFVHFDVEQFQSRFRGFGPPRSRSVLF